MAEPIDKVKLVYFMLGLLLATVVYANLIVIATPRDDMVAHNPEGIAMLSSEFHGSVIEIPVIAVGQNAMIGEIATMTIQGVPGDSSTYLRTNPYVDPELQYSSNTAAQVARRYLDDSSDAGEMDFIMTYQISSSYLGGESAGAAKALGMIALYQGKDLRHDVVITGTIYPNGRIGHVEAIPEKIEAAARSGYRAIIIPASQGTVSFSDRFTLRRADRSFSIDELIGFSEERYGIDVILANDIDEAIEHALI